MVVSITQAETKPRQERAWCRLAMLAKLDPSATDCVGGSECNLLRLKDSGLYKVLLMLSLGQLSGQGVHTTDRSQCPQKPGLRHTDPPATTLKTLNPKNPKPSPLQAPWK